MTEQAVLFNKDVGYFSTENAAKDLLNKLFDKNFPQTASAHVPYEYLGDSKRENQNQMETKADPVEFKGIRIKDWVIASNKSHITPLDLVEKYEKFVSCSFWFVVCEMKIFCLFVFCVLCLCLRTESRKKPH